LKALINVLAVVVLSMSIASLTSGCNKDLEVIEAPVVQLCVEGVNYMRVADDECDKADKKPYNNWVYIVDNPVFHAEIPAVGEYVRPRQWFTYQKPTDKGEIVRVPAEGAIFADREPS
jgi:hypothetical protein